MISLISYSWALFQLCKRYSVLVVQEIQEVQEIPNISHETEKK